MTAISAFGVTQHSQIFHFSLEIEFNALRFINYTIPRLCSTYAVASLMKKFWTHCIFVMTVSETVMVETIPYSNIGLTHSPQFVDLQNGCGTWTPFFVDQYP